MYASEEGYTGVGDDALMSRLVNWRLTFEQRLDISASLRWLKTFTVHFLAKRTLQNCPLDFLKKPITFSIIAVDQPSPGIRSSWSAMKEIISETMKGQEPDEVIQDLKAAIDAAPRSCDETGRMIGTFQILIRQQTGIVIPAALHCEMVLATLGLKECRDAALRYGGQPLKDLFEVQRLSTCFSDQLTVA